jgi:3-deoxy-D-manno-octulosonic-acid transferase
MTWLYELLLGIAFLAYVPKALLKKRLPHAGWSMRLGRYPEAIRERFGAGGAIWVHAVSVGEVMAARPVIEALRQAHPAAPIVLSTVTPAGYAVAATWLGERGAAIYGPLDFRICVERAIAAIRPRALVLVESELWPTLVVRLRRRQVPVAVINGRISTRAFGRYMAARPLLRGLLRGIDRFLMQTPTDAERVIAMGAPAERVQVLGSLKWDASLIGQPDPQEAAALRHQLGADGQPLIVAGSTHRGEEEALLAAVQGIRGHLDATRLILAPRHLERVPDVEALVARHGLIGRLAGQSAGAPAWDVLIVDTVGQLPRFYALASLVIVGGSFIPHGGQNPIEPASLGKAILFGPHMHNFTDIAQQLLAGHGARQLAGANELTAALLELLADPARTAAMGQRALAVTERSRGVARRTVEQLAPLLASSCCK